MVDDINLNILYITLSMFVAIMIGIAIIWSYLKSTSAFVVFFSFIVLIYSIISMIYTLMKKSTYDVNEYNIILGTDFFMSILSFIVMTYFGVKIVWQ
jgi:hypothetical protein